MMIKGTNSPVATCSRGMKIIPDVVFDSANPQQFGPVRFQNYIYTWDWQF